METHPNSRHIPYAPTETADRYLEEELEHLKARLSDD